MVAEQENLLTRHNYFFIYLFYNDFATVDFCENYATIAKRKRQISQRRQNESLPIIDYSLTLFGNFFERNNVETSKIVNITAKKAGNILTEMFCAISPKTAGIANMPI